MIKRIAITGPESTGKSSLAEKLANHFGTRWVPEYARAYLEKLGRPYEKSDLVEMAKGQMLQEDEMVKKADRLLFCDTDLLVFKIWCQHRFGHLHPTISENYERRQYHLYLLTNIDIPWKYDPQREHPHLRQFFFQWYERELKKKDQPYVIISGDHRQRFDSAVEAVENLMNAPDA
jgi:NadR type nicotinamide-nucleotide adenylyltransferase